MDKGLMQDIESRILHEDNHLIIINKRCSEIVQGDKTGDEPLSEQIKRFIKMRDSKPGNVFLGVVHRIDRPTSGIVVFSKTGKALSRMSNLFKANQVKKIYWAVVNTLPPKPQEELVHYLIRDSRHNKSTAYPEPLPGAKEARLLYSVVGKSDRYFFLEIEPLTGRHHQIRAQCKAIGLWIKGDLKYGAPRSNPGGGIHLHARSIEFSHPVRDETVTITAPPPYDVLWDEFVKLL